MPIPSSMHLPKPKSWDEFEDMVCDAMKIRWGHSDVTRNGRPGQKQDGVDIYGDNELGLFSGVQCKNTKDGIVKDIIKKEVGNAERFKPKIKALYIATTADTDAEIQKYVRLLSRNRSKLGKYPVLVLFWNDLHQEIVKDKVILKKYYPQISILVNGLEDSENAKLSVLGIAYRGLRISGYIKLLFGEIGMMAGEDPGQFTQLCIEIKAYAKQLFDPHQYDDISGQLDEINDLCFKRCDDKEQSDLRWEKVISLAKIIEKKIKVLETILSTELLSLFVLGEILSFLDMEAFDTFEEYHGTVKKYHQKIISGFKLLGVGDSLIKDINQQLEYAETNDSFSVYNIPSRLYSMAREIIKG